MRRSLVVVWGVWLIFGMIGLVSLIIVAMGRDIGMGYGAFSAFMLAVSVVLIWKSTRNYLARPKKDKQHDR